MKRSIPTEGPSREGAGWAWVFSVLLHKFWPQQTSKPRSGIFPPVPPGSFHTLLSSCYPHRLTHRLGLLFIAVTKHYDRKQLGREKVYSTSQFIIHDEGVSAQELKARTEAEAMGPVKLKLSTLCLCLQVCAATSVHAINIFKAIINLVIQSSRDRWTKEMKETFVKGGGKNICHRETEGRVYNFMLQNPFLLVQSASWF